MSKQHPQIAQMDADKGKKRENPLRESASPAVKDFFPPRPKSRPTVYAYEDTNPQYAGLLKVGYTTVDVQSRVAQQYPIAGFRHALRRNASSVSMYHP